MYRDGSCHRDDFNSIPDIRAAPENSTSKADPQTAVSSGTPQKKGAGHSPFCSLLLFLLGEIIKLENRVCLVAYSF